MNKKPISKSKSSYLKRKNSTKVNSNNICLSKINNNSLPKVTVVVNTMREHSLENVFENYDRQLYTESEMIIVLNNNCMNLKSWRVEASKHKKVRVYQLDEDITAGSCLNFAISKAKCDIIVKFDDDDYYGPKYLYSIVQAFNRTNADIVGKAASFVYFKKSKILAIRHPQKENKYVYHMDGPTMSIRKYVFNKVKFRDISRGVDTYFSKDCTANGYKIYSTDRFHHVYIRQESPQKHCWQISDEEHLKMCEIVKENIDSFTNIVDI